MSGSQGGAWTGNRPVGRQRPPPTRQHPENQRLPPDPHNGHGKQHLSALLATFNLLAFLFHTVLDLMDSRYQRIRQFLPRKRFFNDLRALTCYLCFESWDALMAFMIKGLELDVPDTS